MRDSAVKPQAGHPPDEHGHRFEPLESFAACARRLAGQDSGAASWLEDCISRGIFQQLNQEFVDELAAVLRATAAGEILEVAAGRGELAEALNRSGLRVRATDPGGWQDLRAPGWVEARTALEALHCYRPHTVLVCWPPVDAGVYRAIFGASSARNLVAVDHCQDWMAELPAGWDVTPLDSVNRYSLCRLDYLDQISAGRLVQHARVYRVARGEA